MRKYSGETFLNVADVKDGSIQLQIAVVKEGRYDKPNVVFESGEILGLNATNNKILIKAYGPDSELWIGKEIELFLGEVEYQGQKQPAVLVKPISPPIHKLEKPAKAEAAQPDPSDEIPF